ncbi:MAG: OPT/YSL family transporter [Candidatus Micrarchaeota archaeon]
MALSPESVGKPGFTLRACVVAIVLTVFLSAASIYISLSLGAMPWPIIISVVMSGALLKALGIIRRTDIHEMNVAQAGASIGGVVGSAAAFTIPAAWYLSMKGVEVEALPITTIIIICITAGVLGILLSVSIRRVFIDEENLPYASGKAGADVLIAGDEGGKNARIILLAGGLAGLFMIGTYITGNAVVSIPELAGVGLVLVVALFIAPLAAGIGYILGPRISVHSWFGGSLVGWGIIVPLLFSQGTELGDAIEIVQNLGMGILLGSGVGFLLMYLVPNAKKIFLPMFTGNQWYARAAPIVSLVAMGILWAIGVEPLASFLTVLGVWIVVGIAARMTGETDIDPYEQFGIIVVVSIGLIWALLGLNLGYTSSFTIVAFVTIAAAVVGDIGFDYKSAKIIGTRAIDIIKVDIIAVVFAGITTPFVLDLIRRSYAEELFTQTMPATQATLVAGSIGGFTYPHIFMVGFLVALLWEFAMTRFKCKSPISAMAFGIGMFIGFALSIPFAVGGTIRYLTRGKQDAKQVGMLASAGIMGGVGIGGFARGALIISGVGIQETDIALGVFFGLLLVLWLGLRVRENNDRR